MYATHGHYADLHLTDADARAAGRRSDGADRRAARRRARTAEDYEAALAPIYAWIHAVAQRVAPELGGRLHGGSVRGWHALTGPGDAGARGRALAAAFPALGVALNRAGIGPLRADLSGRRAAPRPGCTAIEQVARRGCAVPAPVRLVFGHTHRAGPLPGDDPAEWRTAAGGQLDQQRLLGARAGFWARSGRSPYRVGFAVTVGDAGPPALVNLGRLAVTAQPGRA